MAFTQLSTEVRHGTLTLLEEPDMLLDSIRHRTVIGTEIHAVSTAHFNRGAQSNEILSNAVYVEARLDIFSF
jgi:hypothetical protein